MLTRQAVRQKEVVVESGGVLLPGTLSIPGEASGLVLFAHGSGSSRFSSRNQKVAAYLNTLGLGTLLFDLLTADESEADDSTAEYRFNIPWLGRRLDGALDWLSSLNVSGILHYGLFGASTGAAAALITAAHRPHMVSAVVSRGGRPDLAGQALGQVAAPVLLIVGGLDGQVIELNKQAAALLRCEYEIAIVPGATHLFPEAGKLDEVCRLAGRWFEHHTATTSS